MISSKGVLSGVKQKSIKVIPLEQVIKRSKLLPIRIIYKLMYQLTSTLSTINEETCNIPKLGIKDLYVNDCDDIEKLDVFIMSGIITQSKQKKQITIMNQLKDILIELGFDHIDVKKFNCFDDILLYILRMLNIDLNKLGWRKQILENIYGLQITYNDDFNCNKTYIFHVKTPYYIINNQDEQILIKWIHVDDEQNRLTEINNNKELLSQQQQLNNFDLLYSYNLEINKSSLMFLKKYSQTLREYSLMSKDILGVNEKMKICSKLANELQTLHLQNKIHRDLKPENIMVTAMHNQKSCEITKQNLTQIDFLKWSIIDFELNIEIGQKDDIGKGTKSYQPPENMNGQPYNESYDIWQMGIIFLYLMVQQIPKKKSRFISKAEYEEILNPILKGLRDTSKKLVYSETMYNVISQMTNYDPKQRPSLKEVIEILNSANIF